MSRKVVVGVIFIAAFTICVRAGQTSQQPTVPAASQTQTVKVNVDMTMVNATVIDAKGRIVTDLAPDNFEVWEDKVQQTIESFAEEDVALSLGIIFDVSGSMKEKIATARDSAVTFLKTGNPDDEYFLIEFNSRPQVSQDFTTDISRLQNHLMFTPTGGTTALFDAVYLGLNKLKEGTNVKRALLLITDGEDNHSRYTYANVADFIKEQDVQLFAVGIVDAVNSDLAMGRTGRSLLDQLTEITGGRAFFPDTVSELPDICTKIAVELKNQYQLGYRSTNENKDGKWRKISLKIHPPEGMGEMIIRGKQGYYAATQGGR